MTILWINWWCSRLAFEIFFSKTHEESTNKSNKPVFNKVMEGTIVQLIHNTGHFRCEVDPLDLLRLCLLHSRVRVWIQWVVRIFVRGFAQSKDLFDQSLVQFVFACYQILAQFVNNTSESAWNLLQKVSEIGRHC